MYLCITKIKNLQKYSFYQLFMRIYRYKKYLIETRFYITCFLSIFTTKLSALYFVSMWILENFFWSLQILLCMRCADCINLS